MRIFYSGGVGGNKGVFGRHFPETFGLDVMLTFFQIKTGTPQDRMKKARSDTTRRFRLLKRRRPS